MEKQTPLISQEEGKKFIENFLNEFQLPFESKFEEDFSKRVKEDLSKVHIFLNRQSKTFKWIADFLEIFDQNVKLVLNVLEFSLANRNEEANTTFLDLVNTSKIQETIEINQFDFIRIRPSEEKPPLTKLELFHISFKKRRKCKSYRYSILGQPALYLGESIEICVSEVFGGFESSSNFYVSSFRNKRALRLLSIKNPLDFFHEFDKYQNTNLIILDFFRSLPLIIACFYKTPLPHNYSFNPEYIIPQMLICFASKQEKIDGIKYPSTKYPYTLNEKIIYNYAFLAKKPNSEGYCENLLELFDWTEPLYFRKLEENFKKLKLELNQKQNELGVSIKLKNQMDAFQKGIDSKQ